MLGSSYIPIIPLLQGGGPPKVEGFRALGLSLFFFNGFRASFVEDFLGR